MLRLKARGLPILDPVTLNRLGPQKPWPHNFPAGGNRFATDLVDASGKTTLTVAQNRHDNYLPMETFIPCASIAAT